MKQLIFVLSFAMIACTGNNKKEKEEQPVSKRVYFIEPEDGAKLTSPITIKMGVDGLEVEPAGEQNEGKGHHHLVINGTFVEKGVMVPVDSAHIHYGDGQTQTEVSLPPGEHTLTLQFADGLHISYGKELSARITVEILADSLSLE